MPEQPSENTYLCVAEDVENAARLLPLGDLMREALMEIAQEAREKAGDVG